MAEKKDKKLTGSQKAAILMLALGEQVAAELIKYLNADEVKKLGIEMSNLRGVDPKTTTEVLTEFSDQFQDSEAIRVLGEEYFRQLLPNALGPEKAQDVIKSIEKEKEKIPFKNIRDMDAKLLANFLRAEHPQTIALVLAHLGEEKSAQVLYHLPTGLQFEVINRIVNLETVPTEIVREVDDALENELLSLGGEMQQILGGVRKVAEILNRCDRRTSDSILQAMEEADAETAEKVRKLMFVFDDLVAVPDVGIRELLKEVDNKDLVVALKTASEELKQKIFRNLSKRAAQILEEDLAVLGPVRLSEVETAQQRIIEVARRLEKEGRIILAGGEGGDALV